ncbi:hypothetical protein [Inhella gelatinilytica]|uniref:Uncharacterized protein n=1 Tax=Inhella gelatinilytica TaxID=2795030 RepID=A0A931NG54_9BURK|nr:hypothetical protein [Inhella gelatinilytica]MBH9554241.1 hypothetical protein [Inhella gelatinilytica]
MKSTHDLQLKSPVTGILFPARLDGRRSSADAGLRVMAAVLRAQNQGKWAQQLDVEDHWRQHYPMYWRQMVASALASPRVALDGATSGLQALWLSLLWTNERGQEISLRAALELPEGKPFQTHTLRGTGAPSVQPWSVPYRGRQLQGQELLLQLIRWVESGVMEPSAAKALGRCVRHPEWFDLSDRHIALLGAGSEMGALKWLMRWRANVYAVDLPRPEVHSRLQDACTMGNGTLHVPVRGSPGLDGAGADLLQDAPRIAEWLLSLGKNLDLACMAYADGERHLRLSAAMDMVTSAVVQAQPQSSLAYLATPTDVFAVPPEAADASEWVYARRSWGGRLAGALSRGLWFAPNSPQRFEESGRRLGLVDALVVQQGPNYALAKRLQQWRALLARSMGHRVSFNVAPATRTRSVLSNRLLAAGFGGAGAFGLEVFEPETTRALMAGLWVHDLRTDRAPADPAVGLGHPFELFMDQAIHGGLWRMAYAPRSVLPLAVASGWWKTR